MTADLQQWLNRLPYNTPLVRRQAHLLQTMFIVLLGGTIVGIILAPISNQTTESLIAALAVYAAVLVGVGTAWWLLRRGLFRAAAVTVAAALVLALS